MIRRVSAGLMLPVTAFGCALGCYGARSVLFLWGSSFGIAYDSLAEMASAMLVATLVGMVLSALVGAAIGPSATASLGLVISAVGCEAIAREGSPYVSAMLLALGAGLVRPALFAAAARPFSGTQSGWVAALALATYLATTGAAMAASGLATTLIEVSPTLPFVAFGVVLFLAAGPVAADALVQWLVPVDVAPASAIFDGPRTGVAVGIAVLAAVCSVAHVVGSEAQFGLILPSYEPMALYFFGNVAVLAVGLVLMVGFAGTSLAGVQTLGPRLRRVFSAPVVGGVGYAICGVFLLPSLPGAPSAGLAIPLVVLGGAFDAVAIAPSIVGAVSGVHWRLSTALAAIPLAMSMIAVFATRALDGLVPPWVHIAVAGSSLAFGGLLLACGAFFGERWLQDRVDVKDPAARG